jgi:hypothetical protein
MGNTYPPHHSLKSTLISSHKKIKSASKKKNKLLYREQTWNPDECKQQVDSLMDAFASTYESHKQT